MKLNLLFCDVPRFDRRAITHCIAEISLNINASLAQDLTDILLDGDMVDIEMDNKNTGSALRALHKLSMDYETVK